MPWNSGRTHESLINFAKRIPLQKISDRYYEITGIYEYRYSVNAFK